MTKRRAPEAGYAFPEKDQFREFVWQQIGARSPWRERSQHVALMPSSEGLEIEVALRRGFAESSIHIIDNNPAIVAVLKRKYTEVHTYGVSIERAHQRIAARGLRLYGASLDLCSTASWDTADMFGACSQCDAWENGARIVVNVLRGRESGLTRRSHTTGKHIMRADWARRFLKGWDDSTGLVATPHDCWRAFIVMASLPSHVVIPIKTRPYRSVNGQTFLTMSLAAYRLTDLRGAVDRGGAWVKRAADVFAFYFNMHHTFDHLLQSNDPTDEDGRYPDDFCVMAKAKFEAIVEGHTPVHPLIMRAITIELAKYQKLGRRAWG